MSTAIFEPCGGERWRNPFPMYKQLRDEDPVHHVLDNGAGQDYYVLSRFNHVFEAVVDSATFSSAAGLTVNYDDMDKLGLESPIVMMDPPEHTDLRKLAVKRFTPKQVRELDSMVRAFVVERIDAIREMGNADIVAELLKPLPSFVVAHSLGVPAEDRHRFDTWTHATVDANAEGSLLDANAVVADLFGFFARLIEKRRAEPRDDMLSALILGRLKTGEEVSMAKLLGMAFTMVTGGNDTVTGLLGGTLEILTRYPEQRARLIEDPSAIPAAIEEFLRLTSPVQGLTRTTTRDVEIDGHVIPEGRKAMLLYASANRDEREFGADAEACNVSRKIRRHIALGYGPHHCIGAALARLQGRITLEELLTRCPDFAVDADAGTYATGAYTRRFTTLPFVAQA